MEERASSFEWSVNDADLLASLRRVGEHQTDNNTTDEDTEEDEGSSHQAFQHNWESLNNSQFIKYVNELSERNSDSMLLRSSFTEKKPDTTDPFSDTIQLVSSPKEYQFAQKISSCIDNDDNLENLNENPEALTYDQEARAERFAFNDHESYFTTKRDKQQEQNDEYVEFINKANQFKNSNNASKSSSFPQIFNNLSIHVNGHTSPDIMTLRKLIILHGGKFIQHLSSKGSVNYIVAQHLPPRKRIQFGNCRVVKPSWITESIKLGALKNWIPYRVENLVEYGQQNLIVNNSGTVEFHEQNPRLVSDAVEPHHNEDVEEENVLNDLESSQENPVVAIDAKHPDFLRQFFSKSRLHHLSTWKTELRSTFLNKAIAVLKSRNISSRLKDRVILHVDFDCFFTTVSAQCQKPPIDINKIPCCVTHGGSSADIASCNYVARKFGVKNGMWFSTAKRLCPELVCMKYEFKEYEKKSNLFYESLLKLNIDSILPVSVDEALVDITTMCQTKNIYNLVRDLKTQLDLATSCSLSCGVGANVLLAKLALKMAKPNGCYRIPFDNQMLDIISPVLVTDLPGIGYKTAAKLNDAYSEPVNLKMVRSIPKEELIKLFGIKTGEMIHNYSFGRDETSIDIIKDFEKFTRKSISIDINWGIRFDTDVQVESFLARLSGELQDRLKHAELVGATLTMKLASRHPDAPKETEKYLGMGRCNFVSKSTKLGVHTNEKKILGLELKYLWRSMGIDPVELRGVSVSLGKLLGEKDATQGNFQKRIDRFLGLTKRDNESNLPQSNTNMISSSPTKNNNDDKLLGLNQLESTPKFQGSRFSTPKHDRITYRTFTGTDEEAIDWEVFSLLPKEIQEEIKGELRKRNLKTSPKKRKKFDNRRDIAHLLSPSKKRNLIILNEKPKIMFQGVPLDQLELVKERILQWICSTIIIDNGIEENDLALFNDFMVELLDAAEYLIYQDIVNWISERVNIRKLRPGYANWRQIIINLNSWIAEVKYADFESSL